MNYCSFAFALCFCPHTQRKRWGNIQRTNPFCSSSHSSTPQTPGAVRRIPRPLSPFPAVNATALAVDCPPPRLRYRPSDTTFSCCRRAGADDGLRESRLLPTRVVLSVGGPQRLSRKPLSPTPVGCSLPWRASPPERPQLELKHVSPFEA